MNKICVYCGSKPGNDPAFIDAAKALGHSMAGRGIGLVYGGANIGLMGEVANAALDNGGEVIGVIPSGLFENELAHPGLSKLINVDNMHQRKEKMAALADGFIALPGGFGTFEELLEVITWSQLKIHHKPTGMLSVNGYYDQLSAFIGHAAEQGFIKPSHQSLYFIERNPEVLLDLLVERSREMQKPDFRL